VKGTNADGRMDYMREGRKEGRKEGLYEGRTI
jgi:hypothetical protein